MDTVFNEISVFFPFLVAVAYARCTCIQCMCVYARGRACLCVCVCGVCTDQDFFLQPFFSAASHWPNLLSRNKASWNSTLTSNRKFSQKTEDCKENVEYMGIIILNHTGLHCLVLGGGERGRQYTQTAVLSPPE